MIKPLMIRAVLGLALCWLAPLLAAEQASSAPAVAVDGGPAQVVNRLHDQLLALSSQTRLSVAERAATLEPVVRETHNLPFIARLMLRRDWDQLSASQQEQFLDRFAQLSVLDYAGRFRDMQQGEFSVPAVEAARADRARVEVALTTRKRSVTFAYTLDRGTAGWQIVSIVVDGVSEMALRRSEYSETLAEHGFDALLALVDRQIAERQGR